MGLQNSFGELRWYKTKKDDVKTKLKLYSIIFLNLIKHRLT